MDKLRICILYIYFFFLPIENWSPFGSKTDLFRPALIFAMAYVFLSIFDIKRNYELSKSKNFLLPAFLTWYFITFTSLIYFLYLPEAGFSINLTLVFCIITFWLIANDISRYPFLEKHFLFIVMFSGIFLSLMFHFSIGLDIGYLGRLSLLGNNANIISLTAVISILVIFYIVLEKPIFFSKWRFCLVLFFPLLLQTIASTGSKGGVVLLCVSFVTYLFALNKTFKEKFIIIIFGLLAFYIGYNYLLKNDVFALRWSQFLEEGDTTGRSIKWIFALKVFLENPFFGVGENGLAFLGTPVLGDYHPHNVYLYVLSTGGILAFLPFLSFIFRLIKRSFVNAKKKRSSFYIVLLLLLLLHFFKAGGGLNSKLIWSYFAIIAFSNTPPLHFNKKQQERMI